MSQHLECRDHVATDRLPAALRSCLAHEKLKPSSSWAIKALHERMYVTHAESLLNPCMLVQHGLQSTAKNICGIYLSVDRLQAQCVHV